VYCKSITLFDFDEWFLPYVCSATADNVTNVPIGSLSNE